MTRNLIRVALLLLGVVALLGILHQPLLTVLGNIVVYQRDDFDRVDAVIVPSGVVPDRVFQAVDLLLRSRADTAILFRQKLPQHFETLEELGIDFSEDHEINRQVLRKLGVDESRVRVIPEVVDSTWEEAEALRRYLESERLDSIVITTCRYHSYRAFLNFQESLRDTGVAVYSLPSTHCFYLPDAWWKDRDQTKVLYVELASLAAFFLGSR